MLLQLVHGRRHVTCMLPSTEARRIFLRSVVLPLSEPTGVYGSFCVIGSGCEHHETCILAFLLTGPSLSY